MTLVTPFAAIEADIAGQSLAMLANAMVTPEVGDPFVAEFDLADVDPISAPSIVADAQIVYLADAATLQPGETVTINGAAYRVASDPVRNGQMLTAQLREVP